MGVNSSLINDFEIRCPEGVPQRVLDENRGEIFLHLVRFENHGLVYLDLLDVSQHRNTLSSTGDIEHENQGYNREGLHE